MNNVRDLQERVHSKNRFEKHLVFSSEYFNMSTVAQDDGIFKVQEILYHNKKSATKSFKITKCFCR